MNQTQPAPAQSVETLCPLCGASRNVVEGHGSAMEVADALNCCLLSGCRDSKRCKDEVSRLIDFMREYGQG